MTAMFDQTTKLEPRAASEHLAMSRIIQGWWRAFLTWRLEQAAFAQLSSMTDRELADIGLSRAELSLAVKGKIPRNRCIYDFGETKR